MGAITLEKLEADCAWYYHDVHKLRYAFEGVIDVKVEQGRHLVPRQLAAWIPAGVTHRLWLDQQRSAAIT